MKGDKKDRREDSMERDNKNQDKNHERDQRRENKHDTERVRERGKKSKRESEKRFINTEIDRVQRREARGSWRHTEKKREPNREIIRGGTDIKKGHIKRKNKRARE